MVLKGEKRLRPQAELGGGRGDPCLQTYDFIKFFQVKPGGSASFIIFKTLVVNTKKTRSYSIHSQQNFNIKLIERMFFYCAIQKC